MRLAVINDYQKLAEEAADWTQLVGDVEVEFFSERLTNPVAAAAVLEPYDIVITAREETQFDAALLAQLPKL